ncbi:MAG TPA: DegT/DnrJ/EryC1/StrS family aminotransferase [Ilumatobacter sp.]|nr:DegT/DnrJ/EryC1/StrS family aminotransferase [Ilumatobacter sp.]
MPAIGAREVAGAVRVLAGGNLSRFQSGRASRTQVFEQRLQSTIGVRHALAVNSGTSALVCALVGAGIGPGDEVLVPAYTWVATAAAPLAVGAVPVLVDIDESLTIDPLDVERKLTPYTRAIIPVHMRNLVADMDALMQIATERGLVVVEDACQAVGVSYRGRRVGSIGNAGAFSFNQQKNIKCGEGGAVLTNDSRLFARAGMYHDVGTYSREGRFDTDEPLFVGLNLRMPEISAAVLDPQLRRIDKQIAQRQARRRVIVEELSLHPRVRISPHNDPASAVGVSVIFDDPADAQRFGRSRGVNRLIETGRHVYTNWQSILEKRSFDPRLDPYQWAHRPIDPADADCATTLDILERTCGVSVAPDVPIPVLRQIIRRAVKGL